MKAASIDAVVVAYNSAQEIQELADSGPIRSAFRRVIVVDNASQDPSGDVARAAGFQTISNSENWGFGYAVNQAVASTDASLVAIVNPDIRVPRPEVVHRLARQFDDPSVGVVAPRLRLPDGSVQDSARDVPTPMSLVRRRWGDARHGALDHSEPIDVPWLAGAFLLVRRSAFEAVDGFDERFFLYFEDVDLCVRIRQAGYRVIYDPTQEVGHDHQAQSRRSLLGWATRQHMRSAVRFYTHHPGTVLPRTAGRLTRADGPPAFVAWTSQTTRADEIADSLGGVARRFDGYGLPGRWSAPVRYVLNAVGTAVWLARTRPRAIITQNPPILLGVLGWAYGRLAGRPVLLDSHPASFGRKGDRLWQALLPLHRWVARRADLVLVTVPELAEEVEGWGARAAVVHEAPPLETSASPPTPGLRWPPKILVVAVFAPDEPIAEVVEAARLVPEVRFDITGDQEKVPRAIREDAPENVDFVGFFEKPAYWRALEDADAVLVLTTESTSVVRGGYEAVYARRPLITSRSPALKEVFPYAIHVENSVSGIANGIRRWLKEHDQLVEQSGQALATQEQRWSRQLAEVTAAAGLNGDGP